MKRRRARDNPGSAGGVLLTLIGLGIAGFSGYELLTRDKAPERPAPPVLKPGASTTTKPAPPTVAATTTTTTTTTAPAAKPPLPMPTAAQAQQVVQAGQAIASGFDSVFGSSSPAPTFGDGSSPSTPVDIDATGVSGFGVGKHGGGGAPVNLVAAGFDLSSCAVHGGYQAPACVLAYQGALTFLSTALGKPAWSAPLSGTLDAATTAAVTAFQGDNPPLKVDGKAGKATAGKIIALVTANAAATPSS